MLTTEKNPNRNNKKEKKRIPTTRKSSQQKWGNSIEVVTENHKKIIYMHAQDNNQNKRQTEKKTKLHNFHYLNFTLSEKKNDSKSKIEMIGFFETQKKNPH